MSEKPSTSSNTHAKAFQGETLDCLAKKIDDWCKDYTVPVDIVSVDVKFTIIKGPSSSGERVRVMWYALVIYND